MNPARGPQGSLFTPTPGPLFNSSAFAATSFLPVFKVEFNCQLENRDI
jgi:hypothetical protein